MVHSKNLEETALWSAYQEKEAPGSKRGIWVKEAYEMAANYLKDVRQTFQNYTLHDETHILNVLDAMGGLLGNHISQLTVGEMELLILAASFHDLGMVYTEKEKERWYGDSMACKKFLRENCPELIGRPAGDWSADKREWYLRTLHPFRLNEVLQNEAWKELFENCPLDVVPKRCVIAVCQAHGENPESLPLNKNLAHLPADDANPLFCAMLLRLADLLDFDDTRAPKVLYSYVACNAKSRSEWDKHQASAGFRYPEAPCVDDLPYKARCKNPGVEHAVRHFLDWVDVELMNCMKLQSYCKEPWQKKFTFPRMVRRDEIESDGYMSGDFCLTMDQEQILNLLIGENLYDNMDVFVRELLQNAIDATLLRGKMEQGFDPEESRIDLWEWNDMEGNTWFRIDDEGTGMTLGMLQRYFLKVGKSYYSSKELERDLSDHGRQEKFYGISSFGIGFLSSFLCGDCAEVSTLYFDPQKNQREEGDIDSYQTIHNGLRLKVTGLSGYYTLKNQSRHHQADEKFPTPFNAPGSIPGFQERDGYRSKPGTSIVICLNTGKLGALNLQESAKKYLCGSRVPVYYNNKRIGSTYKELMEAAHKLEGENVYELTPKQKEEFDRSFPQACGQYPKVVVTVIPLDTKENQILPDFSGVILKYGVHFDKVLLWKVKDQTYKLKEYSGYKSDSIKATISIKNLNENFPYEWENLKIEYGFEKVSALEKEFEKHPACPKAEDIMEIWKPFCEEVSLKGVWSAYCSYVEKKELKFSIEECVESEINFLFSEGELDAALCAYQGIIPNKDEQFIISGDMEQKNSACIMFLLENKWKPTMEISRSKIVRLPLKVLIAIYGLFNKYHLVQLITDNSERLYKLTDYSLRKWRKARTLQIDTWMIENQNDFFVKVKQKLQKAQKSSDFLDLSSFLSIYWKAYLQDNYQLTINYEEGQIISFHEKEDNEVQEMFDLFPPMMFCRAASEQSRRFICSAYVTERKGITVDHPFVAWLLDNAAKLNQYYQRQFDQIVGCLYNDDVDEIIEICNNIRSQLISLPERHGVDIDSFPQLDMGDFWRMEE